MNYSTQEYSSEDPAIFQAYIIQLNSEDKYATFHITQGGYIGFRRGTLPDDCWVRLTISIRDMVTVYLFPDPPADPEDPPADPIEYGLINNTGDYPISRVYIYSTGSGLSLY
jgi:hypothetical protein